MDLSQLRDLLTQVQSGARVSTAVGEAVQVGDRVIIPVAEIAYGGGGGGGGGKAPQAEEAEGSGGGGGGGVRVRPMGAWVIGPDYERWVPALDLNKMVMVAAGVAMLMLVTIRKIARR